MFCYETVNIVKICKTVLAQYAMSVRLCLMFCVFMAFSFYFMLLFSSILAIHILSASSLSDILYH